MVARVFVVIAAVLFVASAALASVAGPLMPLAEGIRLTDRNMLVWLSEHTSIWLQQVLLMPLLIRPVWLVPVCLGVVALGVAASVNSVRGTPLRRKS